MYRKGAKPMSNAEESLDTNLISRGISADAAVAALPDLIDRESPHEFTPGYASHAKGAHVWDTDGRRYVDLLLHFGSISLGHADDVVDEAVIRQIRRGISSTLRSPLHVELAELLQEQIPGAEQILLLRTGSDATTAAVRVARAYTGRERVARWGYHGWHDWAAPRRGGIPSAIGELTDAFSYNSSDSLKVVLEAHPEEFACVIMMAAEIDEPLPGFLAAVRSLAHRHGAVFILDEVRSGFRLGIGGAQELFGIQADLATFSKAIANGYALSAVTGSSEVLRAAATTSLNSSFFRSADGAAAAIATISELKRRETIGHMWELGQRLQDGLAERAAAAGVPARPVGFPPTPFHAFDVPENMQIMAHRAFCRGGIENGVIFHPRHHWFICDAMDESDLELALDAASEGYRRVGEVLAGAHANSATAS
jgi:glutamate-1-semialdehyde aminotransferase